MDYIQFTALFGAVLGCFIFLYREIKDVREDLKQVSRDLKDDVKAQSLRMDSQAARMDQLYSMFIDLLKSVKRIP